MLLGGLWHGSSWNFLIWGGIHGFMLGVERLLGKESFYRALPRAVKIAITFAAVVLAWTFFRAADLPAAVAYVGSMFGLSAAQPGAGLVAGVIYQPYYLLTFALAALVVWAAPQTWDFTRRLTWPRTAFVLAVTLLAVLALTTQSYNPFIYFIF
jgi:alginate O-acetyltransferase complex protein AlgI